MDHKDIRVEYATIRVEDADTWRNWHRSKRYWGGVLMGVLLMCLFDMTDLHLCIGNCDAQGWDIEDAFK